MWHCGSEQNRKVEEECIVLHTLECTRDPDHLICCDRLGSDTGHRLGVSPVTRQDEHDALIVDCCRHPLLADRTTSCHVPTSRGASAKFGSSAAAPWKPRGSAACAAQSLCGRRPSCFFLFISQLECGMMRSSSPWNCPGRSDAFQDLTLHRVALRSFRSSSPHSPPALPLCLLHSCRAAPSLCFISLHFRHSLAPVYPPSTDFWFWAWSSRPPPLVGVGDGVILTRRRDLGSSPPAPVVVALSVPLLVIPHPRKGRGETTPSPS